MQKGADQQHSTDARRPYRRQDKTQRAAAPQANPLQYGMLKKGYAVFVFYLLAGDRQRK